MNGWDADASDDDEDEPTEIGVTDDAPMNGWDADASNDDDKPTETCATKEAPMNGWDDASAVDSKASDTLRALLTVVVVPPKRVLPPDERHVLRTTV